ncbi:DUF7315 family membrane protein [Halorarius halobius]|uniref:DUF7315 family membrane protein n=1 Tax=Halorarius halobius TaxID=2962671 RepID=UPI0020CD5319|nr:hypothetical protein [Halorarius halobius]
MTDSEPPDAGEEGDPAAGAGPGGRNVEVPLDVYKSVTVFSTLFAVVFVMLAFAMFDAATIQGSLVRRALVSLLSAVGLSVSAGSLSFAVGILGFVFLGAGIVVYVLGTRFKAEGMMKG